MNALLAPLIDLNPLDWLGDKAKEGLAEGWTAMMISLWSAGMWLMESVFSILDRFLTPDVTDPGLQHLYAVTLWISLLVAILTGLGQVGLAVLRRDGRGFATLAIGVVQYGAVVTGWWVVCAGLITATAGLTTGLLQVLMDIEDFGGYQTGAGWPDKVGGTVGATALGLCSLFLLVPAAFGYILIMLVREAALLIITATIPISAAGALADGTRAWMWKSLRWFLAACLTAPLLALVLGIGVQITRAAFPDGPETVHVGPQIGETGGLEVVDSSSAVGMAVVGSVIMLIACFTPFVLFRMLAFVDPGTSSGATFRSSLAANGGVSGLFTGRCAATGQGGDAATATAGDGRAASEDSADAMTANRFQGRLAKTLGGAGAAAGRTMQGMGSLAQHGASLGVDVLGGSGVGAQGYYDTSGSPRPRRHAPVRTNVGTDSHHDSGDHDRGVANDPAAPPINGAAHGPTDGVVSPAVVDDTAFLA